MLALVLVDELQSGSLKKIGAPKYVFQIVFSSVSSACCASALVIASSEYTAKCADSEISRKPA